jgi:two-component system chemotaxis sensor kinase CheA
MDLIRDAFVVLDRGMAYTGSNKKAVELFPGLFNLQKGASILGLENWPAELSADTTASGTDTARKEIEFTLPQRPGKIYSGWTNRVASESGITLGWVILIQDITETVSLIRSIQAQRDEIAAMRDNLKEGIFLMDREYRIQDSYSRAMEDILSGTELQGKPFTELLNKSFSPGELAAVGDYFTMIMDKSVDAEMLEDMNPLKEFSYISTAAGAQKTLCCLFAPVDQGSGEIFVMGTIQDISAETILKKQLAEEEARRQNEMRGLFEVMQVDQKVFGDFIDDTNYEFDRINEMLKNKKLPDRQLLVNMYQSVHSIKSNAVIIGLSGYGEKLHAFETSIKNLREREDEPGFDDLLRIALELEKRMQDMDELIGIVKRLKKFGASGGPNASGETRGYEVFVGALRQACERVAADEQKDVSFVTDKFDREALEKGPRRVMKDILIQLLRNAVHHGIEKPDERLSLGKDKCGTVALSVTVEDTSMIRMVVRDDGKGLDFDHIAKKAGERGLLKSAPGGKIDSRFLSQLIFSSGFSTSETEDIHAGRGIGLNLVKDRLRELGGKITMRNQKGQGLAFDIRIPFAD